MYLGSDSSPERSTLPAAETGAKKTKLRGRNPSSQEHDQGTTKRVLRKKPSQSSPRTGKFYLDHVTTTVMYRTHSNYPNGG